MSLDTIKPNQARALMLAKKQLSTLVCDAVNLEGIAYTLPEVQTLLDGITVGGHRLSEQTIVLNQSAAWEYLFKAVEQKRFNLSKTFVCELHDIAAKEEALERGGFRSTGVTISGTDYLPPPAKALDGLWLKMVESLNQEQNVWKKAIALFLEMSRTQFFYDVNKRMGRFMMNGVLLSEGYPVINVPAKEQETFNRLMLDYYASADKAPMEAFLKNCISQAVIDIMSE